MPCSLAFRKSVRIRKFRCCAVHQLVAIAIGLTKCALQLDLSKDRNELRGLFLQCGRSISVRLLVFRFAFFYYLLNFLTVSMCISPLDVVNEVL